ncbi:MAG: glycosyltransferase family 2 protein [Synechocystis sp.]|nr:glycosyltransferase family 2 protein [Synechocystis sp.]
MAKFFAANNFSLDQTLVIIPVFNEATAIANVIQGLQAQGLSRIRVVDNGSTDGSGEIAQQWGAEVVREPITGYGRACWRGMQDIPDGIDWILFCDGDGSDDLSQLPQFWAATAQADLILGDRRSTVSSRSKLTPAQNIGNGLAVTLIRWGWGFQYQDLGPMRLIRRAALERIAMEDRSFGWTVEMQVRAVELGLKIREIPTQYGDRQGGQSKISGTVSGVIKAGYGILTTLGKLYGRKWQRALHRRMDQLTNAPMPWLSGLAGGLLLLGSTIMAPHGDFASTASFGLFSLGAGLMLAGFALGGLLPTINAGLFWAIAIGCRLILLPMAPGDDIWRCLWEGYLQTQGISPYEFAPNAPELLDLRFPWWQSINYPDVAALYPPIAQWGFRVLAHISPTVWVFKLGFIAADLGICGLLAQRFGYGKSRFYAWNPLVIYNFAGGGHYDSWFILPLVAAWFLADRQKIKTSAFFLGISIGIKWISLPLLGFLIWRRQPVQGLMILLLAALPLLITLSAFCNATACPLIPVQSSFVVEARSADVIPYLLTVIWPASRHQNWIFALPLGVVTGFLLLRCRRFSTFAEGYFFSLFCLSPVIHAWYFTWIMPFAVASGNWGSRLLSASGFVYFLLPYRQFAGLETDRWFLSNGERIILWLPFIMGFLRSLRNPLSPKIDSKNITK